MMTSDWSFLPAVPPGPELVYSYLIPGLDYPYEQFKWCMINLDFDQVMWACSAVMGDNPSNSGWQFKFASAEDCTLFILTWAGQ